MHERVIVVILFCLSVCHALILEIADNYLLRHELTQNDGLRPFIVLHFRISG